MLTTLSPTSTHLSLLQLVLLAVSSLVQDLPRRTFDLSRMKRDFFIRELSLVQFVTKIREEHHHQPTKTETLCMMDLLSSLETKAEGMNPSNKSQPHTPKEQHSSFLFLTRFLNS